ncbi:UNVERIFIED_CONTAM: hypothetical protein Slati_0998000 [Sesamum latifolium]|uniref:Zinc knuckle CX2CX4HX4C domain-containing protein n=1 Tax=Sesamum latifolium TaxID=2727402 RepID=A0AAW2XRR7_9LAMI
MEWIDRLGKVLVLTEDEGEGITLPTHAWIGNKKWRDRALNGGPWIFDKNLIILNYANPDKNPLEVDLNWCQFHVHIHGLPLWIMTRAMADFIGKRLGRFIESDSNQAQFMMGAKVRIRVALDVRLPLKQVLVLRSPEDQELLVSLTYERLSTFCYGCGVLDYILRDCGRRLDNQPDEEEELQYRP